MDSTNKDSLTPNLTKQDWLDIERQGEWFVNYEQEFKKKYFNVTDLRDLLSHSANISIVQGLFVRYSLNDFLMENGFVIDNMVCFSHDGEYPPSYSNIEYAPGKNVSCFYVGTLLLHRDEHKYIFDLDYGHEVTILKLTSLKTTPNCKDILTDLVEYSNKRNFLKGQKIDAKCKFITFDKKYTWDDIILESDKKDEIRRNLANVIEYRDVYEKNGLTVKRGLIFHGVPGSGKTLLGKILCNMVDWTFVWATPKHLENSSDVSRIVSMCRDLSPTILFLEDIDLFGGDRHQNNNVAVLGELMNQLDGIQENHNIITIATTNNIEVLEKALLRRPGRFDRIIEFGDPKYDSIVEMLKLFSKSINLHEDVDFERLAKSLQNLTGAQIRELVNLAVIYAIDDKSFDENKILYVKTEHFNKALPSVRKKDYKSVGFTTNDDDDDNDLSECPSIADIEKAIEKEEGL